MSGHTPGPWSICPARTVEGNYMIVAGEGHNHGLVAETLTIEDARLTRAAPALLNALYRVMNQKCEHPLRLTPAERKELFAAHAEARDAIAVAASAAPANRDEPTQDTTVVVPNQSYAALVAERDALRKAQEWQPIETATKDGKRLILGWDDSASLPMHTEMGVFKGAKRWCNTYGHPFSGEPTHWMPLPAAPTRAALSPEHQREGK